MPYKKKPTVYSKLTTAIIAGLIGTFVVPIIALLVSGGLSFEHIGNFAIGGAIGFALLGYISPKPMEKVLFMMTLFQ